MAKKSFSAKKSFKSLFSRSEANIQASVEEDDVKKSSTLKFFGRWKKKKRSYTSQDSLEVARPETPSLAVSELQDDEEPQRRKSSLFGTFQRSKKSLLSYSENDLRKPKSISASLSWRKKNKKKDLSQTLFSHSEVPDVKSLITEQDEYHYEEDPTTPPDSSSQSLRQNVLSDGSSANQKAGFMPPDVEILSIPFIDSDSDTYHTPPDSPTSTGPGGQGQVLPEASVVVEINTSYTNKDAHKRNLPSGENDTSCSESQLNSNKLQHDNELAAHSDGDVSTEKILEQIRDSGSFNSKSPVLETIESGMNKKIPPDEMIFSGSSKLIVQGSLFSMKSDESDEALCGLRERQSLFTTSLDLSSVEESLSDRNYEDILVESNPTVYYLTSSTSSEKPGCCLDELVHQSVEPAEIESEVFLPSKTAKSIWFNMSETSLVPHKDVETLTEVSSEEGSSQNICNSSSCESSTATLEVIPTIIVHSPAHLDISSQLLAQEVDEDQGTFNSEGHGEDQSSQDTRLTSVPQAEAQAFARNELAKDRGTTKNEQKALENETREPEEQLENARDEPITAEFKTTVRSSSNKVLQKSLVGEDTSEAEVLKIVQNDSIQTLVTTETDQQMFMEETNRAEDQETVQTGLVQNSESRHVQPCLKSMEVSSQEQSAHKDLQRSEVIEETIDGLYSRQKTETPTVFQIEPTKNHQQMFRSKTRELEDQENVSKFMKNSDVSHKTKAPIVQMELTDELETTKTDQQIIMVDPNNPEDQQNSETGYVLESESQSMQPQMEAREVSLFEVGQEENDGFLEVQNAGQTQKAATAKLVTTRNDQQMFVEETHEQEDQGNAATIKNSDVLYNTKAPIVPMEPIEELETTKLNQQINMEETHGQDDLQNVQTMKNSDVSHKTNAPTVQRKPTEELETTKTDQQIIIVDREDKENTETGSVQERLIQPQTKNMEVSSLRQSLYYNYFGKPKVGQEENGELLVVQKAGISQNKRTEKLVTTRIDRQETPEQEDQVNVQTVKNSDVSHKTKTPIVLMEPTEEVEISNTDLQIIVEEILKPEDQETVQTGLIQNIESKHIQPRPKSLEGSPHEQRSQKDSAEECEERCDVLHQKQKTETIELSKPIKQQMFSAGTHNKNAPSRLNLISEPELKNMDVSPQERSSHGQDLEITQMVQEGVSSILQKETREKWSLMKETRKQEDQENSQTASSQGSKSKQIPQLHTVEETSLDKSSSILQRSRSDGFSVVQITETPTFGQKKPTAELGTAQSHQQMFIEETQKSEDQEITGGGVIKNCPSSQIKGFPKESPEQRLRASKVVGLHVEQSMTPASSTGVKEPAAEVCGDTEVLTGQAKQMKPDQPVCQECGAEECSPAPPCWEPPEVSLTGSRMETPTHLDSWIRPASVHQAREEKATVDRTDLQRTGDSCGTSSEDHAEISLVQAWRETFRSAEVTWGEVTVTKVKPDRDDISSYSPSSQATPEDDEEESDTFPDQTFSRSVAAGDRFFHASTALSTLFEESEAEREESVTESDPDMNSGVGILSTTLSQPLTTRDGKEDAMVVRKVSLVSSSTNGSTDHREDSVDDNGFTEASSSASTGYQSGWKNLDSHYTLTDSSSPPSSLSSGYGKGVYTSHFNSQGMGGRSFSAESGGSWKTIESEVQLNSESYSGGRSKAELALPVGVREPELKQTGFDSLVDTSLVIREADDSEIFKATRVEVLPSLTTETNSSALPSDMDNLVDTLKSMDRPVRQRAQRTASNTPFSSLAPIEEDAPISPIPASPVAEPKKALNGLPPDLGLHWSSPKDMRSPLTMMKEQQLAESPNRSLSLPLRASALNSIVMRRGSFNEQSMNEESSLGHVNGLLSPSRLENSFFFQPSENGKTSSIFRAASLPEIGPAHDRMSSPPKTSDALLGSRFERFSFLTSPSSSLSGMSETSRISMPPSIQRSPQDSSIFNHKPPLDLYRPLPSDSTLLNSPPMGLQRSSSLDGSFLINDSKSQKPEPEKNLVLKYRAFPDAYLTKEKEHGKLNPRPGKMLIYDKPGLTGEMIEVRGDVVDATPWEFFGTISVRVIRGGWVLYEKPEFKGEKYALDEGDTELTNPFGPLEEEEGDQMNGEAQDHQEEGTEPKEQLKKFVIGSIRRAVRDYSVPEISLFPEENAEGKKVTFRDTSDDARIFGFPIKANSIIINAGLWLVFAEPFFQGVPRVLEVGGFSTPAAWGVTQPYVGSVHPLKIGEPKVENLHEPKIVLYEKPYFTGKSREIYTSMKDFLTRLDQQQSLFVFSVGSLKVLGGCWVGYEKEGFRGYQYLLEEGEYHDWRVWGGVNSELRSVRVIQADLSEPLLVLHGISDEENEGGEEPSFEVTEAVPDVELFGFGVNTRSIHVLSGAWVAYSHVDFSGDQFVLEKGFYNHSGDWGSTDNKICSVQPILAAPSDGPSFRNEVLLYSEPNFQGTCWVSDQNQGRLPDKLAARSCRVVGGSWVLYEEEQFKGSMYVLSEGDYPTMVSMGLSANPRIRSVRAVPIAFSVPSISLFGLECFEGREVTVDMQITNMHEEGFNPHFLSVRVNSGCWVLCEHSNYRGRQFLLEPIEITNWHKFSSLSGIGSLYPVRHKQRLFRIRNKETGHYMSVQGGVEDMKTGRVVVSEQVDGMSDMWFYQDGLIKNKLARSMSLQVMGNVESGAKVVLWTETRTPVQTWVAPLAGHISSVTFPGMVLDIKGGKSYDRHHVVIREESEELVDQQWELEFL